MHTMSVMTLVSAFAMVLLLCLNIANVSIVAAIFAALCSLPLAIAMVILAKRDYAIYTLMYEDYRVENYYLVSRQSDGSEPSPRTSPHESLPIFLAARRVLATPGSW